MNKITLPDILVTFKKNKKPSRDSKLSEGLKHRMLTLLQANRIFTRKQSRIWTSKYMKLIATLAVYFCVRVTLSITISRHYFFFSWIIKWAQQLETSFIWRTGGLGFSFGVTFFFGPFAQDLATETDPQPKQPKKPPPPPTTGGDWRINSGLESITQHTMNNFRNSN